MSEVWKQIPGFKHYEVSSNGNIRSIDRIISFKRKNSNQHTKGKKEEIEAVIVEQLVEGKLLNPSDDRNGYKRTTIYYDDGKRKDMYIHRLVCMAFLPNPNNYPYVNHIDSNPANNRLDNLEWCDQKMNMQHCVKEGRHVPRKTRAVIQCDVDGNEIREFESVKQACEYMNIHRANVINCCKNPNRKTGGFKWKYKES